jgi:hypothetical protein
MAVLPPASALTEIQLQHYPPQNAQQTPIVGFYTAWVERFREQERYRGLER